MRKRFAAVLMLFGVAAMALCQGEGRLRLVAGSVDHGSMGPDGRTVLVQGTDGVLSMLDLQTGRSRKVLSGSVMISRLDPTGTKIVMLALGTWKGAEYYGLWKADADGSGFRPFLKEPDLAAEERYPIWSEDGTSIAWTRDGRIWTAAADGGGARALTPASKGSFALPLDWMGDEILMSASDGPYHAATLRRLNLRTGKAVDTGMKTAAALFFGSPDRIICYEGSMVVRNLAGGGEESRIGLSEDLEPVHALSRSADCSRYIISSGDSMDTAIEHLYLLETSPPATRAVSVSPNAELEAPELAGLALALRAPLPPAPAGTRGLIALPKGYPADRALALERLNRYRLAAGLRPYSYDPLLSEMGQAHADYILANADSGGHFERPGARGYSKGGDEAAKTSGISYGIADPLAALETLMGGTFHRLQFLRPEETRVGLGHSFGPPATDSYDSGGTLFVTREESGATQPASPRFILFPPDGFDDTLATFAHGENPDPRPGIGPDSPDTGYPITIGLLREDVEKFEGAAVVVKDDRGAELPFWLSYPGRPAVAKPDLGIYAGDTAFIAEAYRNNFNTVFILPTAPLGRGRTYSVRAELRIGGRTEILTWSFATRGPTLWSVRPSSSDQRENLRSALESASDGDTILLAAGEYPIGEPIFIDKALRLVGEPGRTIIRGAMSEGSAALAIDGLVVMRDLDIRGAISIYVNEGSDLLLKGCRISHSDSQSPLSYLERGSRLVLESCDFRSLASPYLAYFRDKPAASAQPTLYLGAGNAFGPLTYEGKRSYGPGSERVLRRPLE